MWANLVNFVLFQAAWISTAWLAGQGFGIWAALPMPTFTLIQLALGPGRRADLALLAVVLPGGFLLDSLWVQIGWVEFAADWPFAAVAPLWIVGMWAGFVMVLNHSLRWLQDYRWLAVGFGFFGGPMSYWAAERAFDAVTFPAGHLPAFCALGIAWAAVTPLLCHLARSFSVRQAVRRTPAGVAQEGR